MLKTKLRKLLRIKLIKTAISAKSSYAHLGSCLSCVDILIEAILYQMRKQDKFILSKGHASLALYVILNYQKKISNKTLLSYCKEGTSLGIHPPGSMKADIPLASGSLGHGLSFAAGLALAYKHKNPKNPRRVFCLISDGECNEGAVWEAALFASHHKLHNLIVMIDKNGIQAFGRNSEVLGDAASVDKWQAFGFQVISCDGHSLSNLEESFLHARRNKLDKPTMLICNTKRGRGITSIEDRIISNYVTPDKKMLTEALKTLKLI